MPTSRHHVLTAAGVGLAALEITGATSTTALAQSWPSSEMEVAKLVQRSADANAALMRGDIDAYSALITYTDDFTLMSPFGGEPTRSAEFTAERMEAIGRFFRNGTFQQELVQSYSSDDMVVLALIERQNVEVGGLPAQDWALRVTLVYRREGSGWRLAHRHADPLVDGISLEHAAALSRGERDD